jgi:NADH-quinone oxidoreductase subunit G
VGSVHTTNEENFYLQKFARQGLGTQSVDHARSGDVHSLIDALAGRENALAAAGDLYTAKSVLVAGADLSQQHPFLAFQIRANFRHHGAAVFTVTPGRVREEGIATKSLHTAEASLLAGIRSLGDELKAKGGDLVIVFGDAIKGDKVYELVAFGDSLGIPVKYLCLVDYSNSRGAIDMNLIPGEVGMSLPGMIAAPDLAALWVVGADPLSSAPLASQAAFVVVQDLFLTATAKRADVVLPSASAYEKAGTVTNTAGQVQRLKKAASVMGAKADLEIFGLLARAMRLDLGPAQNDRVFEEIRRTVRGYDVALPVIATGGAAQTAPLNGRLGSIPDPSLVRSARDTLFTSGSLGRYSKMLGSVAEAPGALYKG